MRYFALLALTCAFFSSAVLSQELDYSKAVSPTVKNSYKGWLIQTQYYEHLYDSNRNSFQTFSSDNKINACNSSLDFIEGQEPKVSDGNEWIFDKWQSRDCGVYQHNVSTVNHRIVIKYCASGSTNQCSYWMNQTLDVRTIVADDGSQEECQAGYAMFYDENTQSNMCAPYKKSAIDPDDLTGCGDSYFMPSGATANTICLNRGGGKPSCKATKINYTDNGVGKNGHFYKGTLVTDSGVCDDPDIPVYEDNASNNKCFKLEQGKFCMADTDKHCTVNDVNPICDDGCISVNGQAFCDPSKHPDAGDGQGGGDYWDDNGSCSISSANFRGSCEAAGGEWESNVPKSVDMCSGSNSYSGSCSVGGASSCYSCDDAGGNWTPDDKSELPTECDPATDSNCSRSIDSNISQLLKEQQNTTDVTQKNNEILGELGLTNRKGFEQLNSSLGGLGDKLDNLSNKLSDNKEKEKTFSGTASGKGEGLNSVFGADEMAALESSIQSKKEELKATQQQIKSELSEILDIKVDGSSGYTSRLLDLGSWGSHDVSLSRFSTDFRLIGNAIFLVFTIWALIILLRND